MVKQGPCVVVTLSQEPKGETEPSIRGGPPNVLISRGQADASIFFLSFFLFLRLIVHSFISLSVY